MAGDTDGLCDQLSAMQLHPQSPVGVMEGPSGSLVTYCDMFAKSNFFVETLEIRACEKLREEELLTEGHTARGTERTQSL